MKIRDPVKKFLSGVTQSLFCIVGSATATAICTSVFAPWANEFAVCIYRIATLHPLVEC